MTGSPRISRRFGPGLLVTAAFIGPGTVTTATLAGARFGAALLWAVVFSTLATMVLQEMSARLGLVSGGRLGEALRATFRGPLSRVLAAGLVLGALAFGNAAFDPHRHRRRPVAAIVLAQALNGLLLPVVAATLLVVVNRSEVVGRYHNGIAANLAGIAVVSVVAGLGLVQLLRVLGILAGG